MITLMPYLRLKLLYLIFLFLGVGLASVSRAQQPGNAEDVAAPPDVRLVIDVSGSMKQNDPNNLRQPAVELLVQLLPEGSKAGVWTFGKMGQHAGSP